MARISPRRRRERTCGVRRSSARRGCVRTSPSPTTPSRARPASSAAAPLNNGSAISGSCPTRTRRSESRPTSTRSTRWHGSTPTRAPFVFETPDFGDRYYTFQIGYADTECDTLPRSAHPRSQLPPLFIHGRSYAGPVPDGMLAVTSRTRYVMICGRVLVQPEDPDDPARVRALQEQMRLRTLPRWKAGDDDANPVPAERLLPGPADVDDVDLLFLHQLGAVLAEDPVDASPTAPGRLVLRRWVYGPAPCSIRRRSRGAPR